MLVLTPRKMESIIITIPEGVLPGSEVVVTIVEIRGDKIRLGINAPREIPVHREEVQRLIAEEGERRA